MVSSKPAIVFLSGEFPSREKMHDILGGAGFFVAADGGFDTALALGITPDVLVGDMDSIRSIPREGQTRIVEFPREKDYTDTELALSHARAEGLERVFLVGGGGGRIDHLLAIAALFQRKQPPDRWYTAFDEIVLIKKSAGIDLPADSIVSFFPLGRTRCRTKGLQWELDDLRWDTGDFGISNRTTDNRLTVEVVEGGVLMIRHLGENDWPISTSADVR